MPILIIHTTAYRKGSDMFARAAATMRDEISARYAGEIISLGIVGKKELTDIFHSLSQQGKLIDEYHFIGHSGMYGPMFGTVDYPEQYSPWELRNLSIPFAPQAKAYFHCCRSARWFAPYFAEHCGVETFGYHWYTAFSSDKHIYRRVRPASAKVYAAGCPGRKSHGLAGSLRKHLGRMPLETMLSFSPGKHQTDASYNLIAHFYNLVFSDIKVRMDEWRWLNAHLPDNHDITVLDIGCGNGAMLKELAPRIHKGIGFDTSDNILEFARQMNPQFSNLSFSRIDGPLLPLPDHSVDVIMSLLSFRYLDWDPLMNEVKRVLRPGGKLLIIDMVTVPVRWREYPLLLRSKYKHYKQRRTMKWFYKILSDMVNHPKWKEMLKHNPIRAEHEMKWYLESRFPGRKTEKINIGWNSCILAFDSGNIENIQDIHLTYP